MKRKLLLLFGASLLASVSFAQEIPNAGFNSWSNNNPNNWVTANAVSFMGNPQSAFMETAAPHLKEGAATLRLTSVRLSANPFAQYGIPDTIGIAFTGVVNFLGPSLITGYPYTARPSALNFYQKYTPTGTDTASATVLLQRWNSSTMSRDTIATGLWQTYTASNEYSLETVTLTYNPDFANTTIYPDTAIILFSSTSLFKPKEGSSFYIDALSWTGWNGVDEMGIKGEGVQVYPNPSSAAVTFDVTVSNAASLEVFDASGRLVDAAEIRKMSASLSTSGYSPGIYFFNVLDNSRNVVDRGRFSVAH